MELVERIIVTSENIYDSNGTVIKVVNTTEVFKKEQK